jgi:hypothetical protein
LPNDKPAEVTNHSTLAVAPEGGLRTIPAVHQSRSWSMVAWKVSVAAGLNSWSKVVSVVFSPLEPSTTLVISVYPGGVAARIHPDHMDRAVGGRGQRQPGCIVVVTIVAVAALAVRVLTRGIFERPDA